MHTNTRRIAISLTVFALLAGAVIGAAADRQGGLFTNILDQFFKKEKPVETAEAVSEAAGTADDAEESGREIHYIARGEGADFTSEFSENGTPRTSTAQETFTKGTFSVRLAGVEGPEHFAKAYPDYELDGTEAGVSLVIRFEADEENELSIIPQDAFYMSLTGADGQATEEYQLMDQEIGGSYNVSLADGEEKTFYRRYLYNPDMRYLVLTAYNDGQACDYCFALEYGDTNVEHQALQSGDKGDAVAALQTKLTALGYYSGSIDSSFGSGTAEAVRAAQADMELEATGVADSAFLKELYARE